nr:RelA/SpoT domain-containing protein [uncultured Campylobacter sp.]
MQLSTMQDIAGLRAVFKNKNDLYAFLTAVKKAYKSKKAVLQIIRENDYIKDPKQDGYRSFHLVFEYQGKKEYIKGYKIELQLRTLNKPRFYTTENAPSLNALRTEVEKMPQEQVEQIKA